MDKNWVSYKMQRQRFNSPFYKKYAPLRYPPKIVPHTTLPTTILLFQNLFSFKINSQSPILSYLRQRSRSRKEKIVPHTILPTTILLFQNLFSSKINSQSPILPYLRQRSRSTKSIIVPHTTPGTVPWNWGTKISGAAIEARVESYDCST